VNGPQADIQNVQTKGKKLSEIDFTHFSRMNRIENAAKLLLQVNMLIKENPVHIPIVKTFLSF
jgi:hypothetical protein